MILPFYFPSEKFIEKSEGCYLYDSDGKKYIDFESGVWCANLGHNHPEINKIIESQLKKSIHQGYFFRSRLAEDLSEKLIQKTGFKDGKSVFLSSGSEAVNLAITLAKELSGRKKVLTTEISYLSAYGHGQNSPKNENLVTIPLNDSSFLSKTEFDKIAAVVIETGGASLGVVKFPEQDFIRELVGFAGQNGIITIANEVTTGMGRTGKWFGFQHYNVVPDMVITGKGLGNGYPVSAVSVSEEIVAQFEKKPFRYAQSHQNDPLGCAVGLQVLNVMETGNWVETGAKTGSFFKNELEKLTEEFPEKVKEVRGRGMMLAIEFQNNFNAEELHRQLFKAGFVTGLKFNTLRFMPPLTIREKDILQLIKTINTRLKNFKYCP